MVPERLISPFVMWALVLCGAAASFLVLPHGLFYASGGIQLAVFALVMVNWLAFFTSSMLSHRQAIRSAAAIERLVTTGPYRYVRHPIYFADMAAIWGAFVAFPAPWLLSAAVWSSLVMSGWAFLEEKALSTRFGTAYIEYRKRTPMLIPDYPAAIRSIFAPRRH